MTANEKVAGILGICAKAGMIIYGTDPVLGAIGRKSTIGIFLASDASQNTVERVLRIAAPTGKPVGHLTQSGTDIARTTGRPGNIVCIALTNEGLYMKITTILKSEVDDLENAERTAVQIIKETRND